MRRLGSPLADYVVGLVGHKWLCRRNGRVVPEQVRQTPTVARTRYEQNEALPLVGWGLSSLLSGDDRRTWGQLAAALEAQCSLNR